MRTVTIFFNGKIIQDLNKDKNATKIIFCGVMFELKTGLVKKLLLVFSVDFISKSFNFTVQRSCEKKLKGNRF